MGLVLGYPGGTTHLYGIAYRGSEPSADLARPGADTRHRAAWFISGDERTGYSDSPLGALMGDNGGVVHVPSPEEDLDLDRAKHATSDLLTHAARREGAIIEQLTAALSWITAFRMANGVGPGSSGTVAGPKMYTRLRSALGRLLGLLDGLDNIGSSLYCVSCGRETGVALADEALSWATIAAPSLEPLLATLPWFGPPSAEVAAVTIVSVTGGIGSGKSTVFHALREAYDTVDGEGGAHVGAGRPAHPLVLVEEGADSPLWSEWLSAQYTGAATPLEFQMFAFQQQVERVRRGLALAASLAVDDVDGRALLLIERSVLDTLYVFLAVDGAPPHHVALFHGLLDLVGPLPSVLIHVRAEPETCVARVKARARGSENSLREDRVRAVAARYAHFLPPDTPCVTVRGQRTLRVETIHNGSTVSLDALTSAVSGLVESLLGGDGDGGES